MRAPIQTSQNVASLSNVFYVCVKGPLVSLLLYLLSVYTSGGSRGVPRVPRNPHFCRFARMRRRPRAHARAQSKTFWTAEPPPFQNPRSATVYPPKGAVEKHAIATESKPDIWTNNCWTEGRKNPLSALELVHDST